MLSHLYVNGNAAPVVSLVFGCGGGVPRDALCCLMQVGGLAHLASGIYKGGNGAEQVPAELLLGQNNNVYLALNYLGRASVRNPEELG